MKKFKAFLIFAALINLMLPNIKLNAEEDIPVKAIEVARTTIINFINNEEARSDFESAGFLLPGEGTGKIELGRGVREYQLDPAEDMSTLSDEDIPSVLIFVGWSFPVFIDDNPRMLITIEKKNDEWVFSTLAKDVHTLIDSRKRWQEKDGFSLSYLRLFGITDFILVKDKNGKTLFYPFRENYRTQLRLYDVSEKDQLLFEPSYIFNKLHEQKSGVRR